MANSLSLLPRSSEYLAFPFVCFACTHLRGESTKRETHKACVARGRGKGKRGSKGLSKPASPEAC